MGLYYPGSCNHLSNIHEFHDLEVEISQGSCVLPETNSSPLKIDGWNTILSYWGGLFSGTTLVSGRVYKDYQFFLRGTFFSSLMQVCCEGNF